LQWLTFYAARVLTFWEPFARFLFYRKQFGVPWYLTAIFALIAAVVVSALFLRKNSRAKEINILQKKMRKIMREAKKKGDASFIYETLENELLPAIRKIRYNKLRKFK
jgi:biopolymer transport protein ExbB/TolQ